MGSALHGFSRGILLLQWASVLWTVWSTTPGEEETDIAWTTFIAMLLVSKCEKEIAVVDFKSS
jgi:hypothetical protein